MVRRLTTCLLTAALLLAAGTTAEAKKAQPERTAAEALAAKHYKPFRRAARPTDELPTPSGWKVDRTRIVASRRLAVGRLDRLELRRTARAPRAGVWEAHLVLLRGREDAALVLHHGVEAAATTGRLTDFVRKGAAAGIPNCDGWHTVVAVPDGATLAVRTNGGLSAQVPVVGNLIDDWSGPGGTISWSRDARRRALRVNRGARVPCAPRSTPVRATLLDGSVALLDRGDGTPPRAVPVGGDLVGTIPGGYRLGRDNTLVFSGGGISAGPVDGCEPPPAIADPAGTTTFVVARDGATTLTLAGPIADLRPERCGAVVPGPLVLGGKVTREAGLTRIVLTGGPVAFGDGATATYTLHVSLHVG